MSATRAMAAAAVLALLGATPAATAQPFPLFAGDPVNAADGRPYQILPGVPLILPQANGEFRPPIVDPSIIGDVDIVVRAGGPMVGPGMPPPAATPPTAVAGGTHVVAGSELPFTVIVSDGDPAAPAGNPLLGPEMDGIPVVVIAFADLDGDGIIGPTDADPDGAADNGRELQEAMFPVGEQIAFFQGGVARGTVAVSQGAPASAGGLRIALTAVAYVGPFDGFLFNNVPDGPGVATLLPFFPPLDPSRVVEGGGRGPRAAPDERLGVVVDPAFDVPVGDPVLGTPFALPLDGSSPTIDRAIVWSGPLSRMRFVTRSSAASFPVPTQASLRRGAGGVLYEPLPSVDVPDDGPGGVLVHVRLVPSDLLDDVTDPPPGATATLVAGRGLVIAAPDTDGDPSRETVPVGGAAGVDIVLGDGGGVNDSGPGAVLTVLTDGFPTETLDVRFVLAGAGTTTTSSATTSVTTTTPTTTTLVGIPAQPFGGDDAGCVPDTRAHLACADRIARAFSKLAGAVIACHCRQATALFRHATPAKADDEACETAGRGKSAKEKLGATLATLGRQGTCAPAQLAAAATEGQALLAYLDGTLNGRVFCAGSVPLGGDDAGFVPPDAGALVCACAAGKNLSALLTSALTCHIRLADADFERTKPFDEEACEEHVAGNRAAHDRYGAAVRRLVAKRTCPPCLGAADQEALASEILSRADGEVNASAYVCP